MLISAAVRTLVLVDAVTGAVQVIEGEPHTSLEGDR